MLKYIADITILAVEIICYLIFFGIFARGKKIKVKQKISAICLLISIVYVCAFFEELYNCEIINDYAYNADSNKIFI